MSDLDKFKRELLNIEKLISLPNAVRDSALDIIRGFDFSDLKRSEKIKISNGLSLMENIANKSLSKEYAIIYNQTCILAVSVLSAYIEKYFKKALD